MSLVDAPAWERDHPTVKAVVGHTKAEIMGAPTERSAALQAAAFPQSDSVNHPKHYTQDPSGVECITITRHRNFNIGNAIKYLWRAGLKFSAALDTRAKQIEDLEKARWYIADEIERIRKEA